MCEVEKVGAVLQKTLIEISPELRKKLLQREIFNRWHEIFKTLADKISPVKIQGDALIVTSTDGAVMDALKFGAADFVTLINEKISPGTPIISEIKFGKSFASPPLRKFPAAKVPPPEVSLTPQEIADCQSKVAAVTDENLRKVLLETLFSHVKSQKRKLQLGWHKCKCCNVLCPPHEIFCNVCAVEQRSKLDLAIRKIFLAAPETTFREVQQKISRQFPHLDCTPDKIESARMDLILQRAAKISYGDTTSDAAIFLVRLIRQLPREKLTDAIITRTLKEFRFNLADQPPLPKYEFSKLQLTAKKIPLLKK